MKGRNWCINGRLKMNGVCVGYGVYRVYNERRWNGGVTLANLSRMVPVLVIWPLPKICALLSIVTSKSLCSD